MLRHALKQLLRRLLGPAGRASAQVLDRDARLVMTPRELASRADQAIDDGIDRTILSPHRHHGLIVIHGGRATATDRQPEGEALSPALPQSGGNAAATSAAVEPQPPPVRHGQAKS